MGYNTQGWVFIQVSKGKMPKLTRLHRGASLFALSRTLSLSFLWWPLTTTPHVRKLLLSPILFLRQILGKLRAKCISERLRVSRRKKWAEKFFPQHFIASTN